MAKTKLSLTAPRYWINSARTYRSWLGMIRRCNNINHSEYHNYGGRGISICKRWGTFKNFLDDMGERPEGKSLDRYPNKNGGYYKSNCRWATQIEQCRNMRNNVNITHNGKTKCISAWAKEVDVKGGTIRWRIKHGWKVKDAFCSHGRKK